MEPGNTFTIEPIILMHKSDEFYCWRDDFTVISPNNPSGIQSIAQYLFTETLRSTMGTYDTYNRDRQGNYHKTPRREYRMKMEKSLRL